MSTLIKIAVGLIIFSSQANATRVLINYELGNQITRSELIVLSNGLIMKNSSLHGKRTYLPDQKLTSSQTAALVKNIDAASKGQQVRVDKLDSPFGGPFGEAKIYSTDGGVSYLYALATDLQSNQGNGPKKTMVCQAGSEADSIRAFIQKLVGDKMPLESIPCK